jgi:hypothetical protein
MASERTNTRAARTCDPPEPARDEIWAEVRGRRVRGVYSAANGWVDVIAANGLTKTAPCCDSSAPEVAQRLLRELYARSAEA